MAFWSYEEKPKEQIPPPPPPPPAWIGLTTIILHRFWNLSDHLLTDFDLQTQIAWDENNNRRNSRSFLAGLHVVSCNFSGDAGICRWSRNL